MKKLLHIIGITLVFTLLIGVGSAFAEEGKSSLAAPFSSLVFTAKIDNVSQPGTSGKIDCTFEITDEYKKECRVYGDMNAGTSGICAVDALTSGKITIPKTVVNAATGTSYTVTAIGDYAFGGTSSVKTSCKYLSEVVLPDTLVSIGSYSFAYCSGLSTLSLPDSLVTIGDHAYYYCTKIANTLKFPASLTTIEGYAFCRCSSLRTVEFLGNAPEVKESAFTGGDNAIEKVVYYGTKLQNTANRFNSQYSVVQPTYYYTVLFYAGKDAMNSGAAPLGKAIISEDVVYRRIDPAINGTSAVYEGSVPEWPQGTSLWVYNDNTILNYFSNTLSDYSKAYPISYDYRDLAKSTMSLNSKARAFSYTGLPVDPGVAVTDTVGGILEEGYDYDVVYQRKDASGAWVTTSNFIDPGEIRAVVSPTPHTSRYFNTISRTFTITFGKDAVFFSPVEETSILGVVSETPCWFRVTGFTEGNYTLAVSKGSPDFLDSEGNPLYPRALPLSSSGFVELPEQVTIHGYNFKVTSLETQAFGASLDFTDNYANIISGVSIPATVTKIGSNAFCNCTLLKKIIFEGDADKIEWGQIVFKGATRIESVIWKGKRADNPYLFSLVEPISSSEPVNYYTITYYDEKAAVGMGNPLGKLILREDVKLLDMWNAVDALSGRYEGAVPDYPSKYLDDGKYWAPTWYFPEVNTDNTKAWASTLSDSVYAYADQSNDAYTLDDAFVMGLENGQAFEYTGSDVLNPDTDFKVYTAVGKQVRYGTDFTVSYEREKPGEAGVWEPTGNIVDDGSLRMTIKGISPYTESLSLAFKINAPTAVVGTLFTYPIGLTEPDGTQTTLDCGFRVSNAATRTVEVYRQTTITTAIPQTTAGEIDISQVVMYRGVAYQVTGVSSRAFSDCTALTGFTLPPSVGSIAASAFSGCTGLTSVTVPDTVSSLGSSVFAQCTNLKRADLGFSSTASTLLFDGDTALESVTMGSRATVVAASMFNGCSSLTELKLPLTLATIAQKAFNGCKALPETFVMPPSVTVRDSSSSSSSSIIGTDAFANSSIDTIEFSEGTASIPAQYLSNHSQIKGIILPSTLATIGSSAFSGTGIAAVSLPASLTSVGDSSFGNCTSLARVTFEGDPNGITFSRPFTLSRNIKQVVYQDKVLAAPALVFTSTPQPAYYSTLSFYTNEEALDLDGEGSATGEPIAEAIVSLKTPLRQINERSLPAGALLEGSLPDLPEGANIWGFGNRYEGNRLPLSNTLKDSLHVYGRSIDLNDLSNGHVLVADSFRYTGGIINPIADKTARVINARGYDLASGIDFTPGYQRRDAEGNWLDSDDLVSVGRVQLTASALAGSSYTGAVSNTYVITDRMVDDLFVADDIYGNPITYRVLSVADERSPGTVAVGSGTSDAQAVASSAAGALSIPELVQDTLGKSFAYTPVKVAPYAFYRCVYLTSITIPSSVESIGAKAFAYEHVNTDVQISLLSTIVLNCNLEETPIDSSAFLGCNAIKNVIYGDKKGNFNSFGGSSGYTRWYTASYYNSEEEAGLGAPLAQVTAKEGKWLYSLSNTDRWPGSDAEPDLPDEGMEWYYDASSLAVDGSLLDSMTVWARYSDQRGFTAEIGLKTAEGEESINARFTRLVDENEEYTGEAALGLGIDGQPAISPSAQGTLIVPAQVSDEDGETYTVTAVSAFALGATETSDACTQLEGIVLPATLTTIEKGAFQNCSSLAKVEFDEVSGLDFIGASAFEGASALTSLVLPETLTHIDTAAFAKSGLVRIRIPQAVATLGKRAFTNCAKLEEVVVGGAMSLSLPAPEGASDTWKALAQAGDPQTGFTTEAGNAAGLSLLDDWTFAECKKLSRVVFDADVPGLTVSEVAFQNDTSLSKVVFGGLRPSEEELFGPIDPTLWVSMSYFESAAMKGSGIRSGAVVVREGTRYDERADTQVLFDSEPVLKDYYEWVFSVDTSLELRDSASAYAQKISYPIDTSEVDDAFRVSCTVDGEELSAAHYGDEVHIAVSSDYAVQPISVTVSNASTGAELLVLEGTTEGIFTMPGASVKVAVEPGLDLVVTSYDVFGNASEPVVLTLKDMAQLAEDKQVENSQAALDYSAWGIYRDPARLYCEEYVRIDDLFENLGIEFNAGDSLVLYSGDNMLGTASYNELYQDRFFYPGLSVGEYEGAQDVPPVLALRSAQSSFAEMPSQASYAQAYRLLFGQTEQQMMNRSDTLTSLVGGITSLSVISGAEDIAGYTVEGVDQAYPWTGSAIEPVPTIKTPAGVALVPQRDYEVRYSNTVDAGIATATITGHGFYTGTIEQSYRITRAQVLAGTTAVDTAAEISLEAFPEGSKGAIVATTSGFADALSASALGGLLDYPLLLSAPNSLPEATKSALSVLSRGNPDFEIIIVGGSSVVSAQVEKTLAGFASDETFISRLGGTTLYDTSYLIYYYGTLVSSWSDTAIVASGKSFQDALSVSPYAVNRGCPLFLSDGTALTADFADALSSGGFERVVAVGGSSVVSENLFASLSASMGSSNAVRLWGNSAYDTSEAVARWELEQGMQISGAGIATGNSYYDALAGSILLGKSNSILLLADTGKLTTFKLLSDNAPSCNLLRFLGGSSVVTPDTRAQAVDALGWDRSTLE